MSRPLLRRASTVLLAACAAVATLLLTAAPAVATEGGGGASEGFGTALWDGMILAAPLGILVGVLAFAMSRPGEIHRDGH